MNARIGSGLRASGAIIFALALAWAIVMPGETPFLGILGGHCESTCMGSSPQPCQGYFQCASAKYCECNSYISSVCHAGNDWCATFPNCAIPAGHSPCYCDQSNQCGDKWS